MTLIIGIRWYKSNEDPCELMLMVGSVHSKLQDITMTNVIILYFCLTWS